jgi:hypothetical protein
MVAQTTETDAESANALDRDIVPRGDILANGESMITLDSSGGKNQYLKVLLGFKGLLG